MSQAAQPELSRPDEASSITRDDIYEMLGNQRRRYALHYLEWRAPDPVELRDLAERVATWENEKPIDELTVPEKKRVQTALHQFHLPKLDESGFITYDPDRQEVVLTDEATDLRVYLDVVPGKDVPWGVLYLGITALCGVTLGYTWLHAGPFIGVIDQVWSLFFLVSIGVTATIHTVYSYRMRLGHSEEPPEVTHR